MYSTDGLEKLVGKKIEKAYGDSQELIFVTDQGTFGFSAEGDCCSHSWFEHFSGSDNLIGRTVIKVDEITLGEVDADNDYECIQVYGWRFHTDKGYFEVEMRNSSNGYCGGYICERDNPSIKGLNELEDR